MINMRISPSPTGMNNEETKDFRFTLRFDRSKCGKNILSAMEAGHLRIEILDYNDVYDLESIYKVSHI